MNKTRNQLGLLTLLVGSSLFLASCGEKEPEPTPQEIQFQANIASLPERDETVTALIQGAIGEAVLDKEGNETGVYEDTLSGGFNRQVALSALSQEQLMEKDKMEQIEIYLNGVLREELYVPANILYGTETVQAQKEAFKASLMKPLSEGEGHIVDALALDSMMKNPDVAHHHVDAVITHLNRVYVKPVIKEDLKSRVVIDGKAYGLELKDTLNSIEKNASEFVELESTSDYRRTDEDKRKLTEYFQESFPDALEIATYKANPSTETLGGFEQNDQGLWLPSDMDRLAYALLHLSYLK